MNIDIEYALSKGSAIAVLLFAAQFLILAVMLLFIGSGWASIGAAAFFLALSAYFIIFADAIMYDGRSRQIHRSVFGEFDIRSMEELREEIEGESA